MSDMYFSYFWTISDFGLFYLKLIMEHHNSITTRSKRSNRIKRKSKKKGGLFTIFRRQKNETSEERKFLSERKIFMNHVRMAIEKRTLNKCLVNNESKQLRSLLNDTFKKIMSLDISFVDKLQKLHQFIVYNDEAILKDAIAKKISCGGVFEAIPKKSDLDDKIERRIISESIRFDPGFDANEYLVYGVIRDDELTKTRTDEAKNTSKEVYHDARETMNKAAADEVKYHDARETMNKAADEAKYHARETMKKTVERNIKNRYDVKPKIKLEYQEILKKISKLERDLDILNQKKLEVDTEKQSVEDDLRNLRAKVKDKGRLKIDTTLM